ncbi:twin-arginine translocase subunit TatC [Leeia sp. TBRC 13508]|uniref:Sec-independent protein translocase protein TatC n=1 Tax=Leeia speluncae TaxID=2884804 RepID=A0ABS8D618_9NEIS|nr:twin-arginine translocase subunit TatC [Leeia speluncae]MCB6183655.1 twin-arginine translocase subunit TatC [Leeia speluncae]
MSDLPQESLLSHLIELRNRLVKTLAVFAIAFCIAIYFSEHLYEILTQPLMKFLPGGLISTGITSPFVVLMKIAALVAFVVTLPHTLFQIWAFIAPGLYAHEKKLLLPFIVSATILFLVGMCFAYFFVFGMVFKFIASILPPNMRWTPDSGTYFEFILNMFFMFGLTFEVPVAVVLMAKIGVVKIKQLKEARPYIIVGSFVIAAIVTPPDVASQLMLAIPLWLLFEAGVLAAQILVKPKSN